MNIIPCGHRVLVKQLQLEAVDDTLKIAREIGLEIVGDDQKRRQEGMDMGVVVAIGPTAFKDFGGEAWCQVGDVIAFAKYSGKAVQDQVTKEKYQVCNDEDIVCILKGINNV